ncbi:L-dopachrome tautomerase-related protein [Isoptericola chiayiensis]|uniref:L-dopachrome tautomerase-related protein n=1 Tax=Isoptericola chiayiensis TaxID=579446 RepID=A0ABP8YED5_9MICO|nr:L-dopachrome tautomerase-related protein [Isoptericola chiayiensis]NOW00100.1 sugar lactone lactonase YvrE [Isoptericola chiayiensis]
MGTWVADGYEVVATLVDNMPTGLTVSDEGRVFVSFPRWGDEVPFTVAEIVDGKPVPFPDPEVNRWTGTEDPGDHLVSVQSVVVDPVGHLWLLDTGAPSFGPTIPGGAKLVEVDLTTNRIVRVIRPLGGMTPTTYLNDVRFDLSRGRAGFAYLTDSQAVGALIVIDLDTGESWARLRGHTSTQATDQFRAVVQGVVRTGYSVGADGIALSPDGNRLYYCPLSSRRLYSVCTDVLRDQDIDDHAAAEHVTDHGDKGASDGLEMDADGTLYATAWEHSAVVKRSPDSTWSTVLHGPDLLWPDTLALGTDGYLYVSVNQLPRSPLFNGAEDRVPPYLIVRAHVGGRPVRLSPPAPAAKPSH